MLTRDSVVWTVGIVGSIATGLAMNYDLFPWLSDSAKHWINLVAFVTGILSGKLATSPLKGKDE